MTPNAPPPSDSQLPDDPMQDAEPDEMEEFSLDQLGQAYAQVLQQNSGDSPSEEDPEPASEATTCLDDASVAEVESLSDHSQTENASDNAPCPISPETIVEAILFVGAPQGTTLTSRKIASVLRDVSPREINQIVKTLNARYESEGSIFRIVNEKGNLKMTVDPAMELFHRECLGRNKNARLSQAAIDVMAVIAYNQPVSSEQIEKIRGRSSGSVIAQLVKRKLIATEEAAPNEKKRKSKRYVTTDRFLDFFGLESIHDLPQSHDVSEVDELMD